MEALDPLARIENETHRAHEAFVDYATMGVGRSMRKLIRRYEEILATGHQPPTKSWNTLSAWSVTYRWQERVTVYDQAIRQEKDASFRAMQEEWKKNRLDLLQATFAKMTKTFPGISFSKMRATEFISAMLMVNKDLRFELGEETEFKDGGVGMVKVVLEMPGKVKTDEPEQ